MSADHGLQTWPPHARPSFVDLDVDAPRPFGPQAIPLLIQVPAVRTPSRGPRPARRPSATATARVRSGAVAARGRSRPRRRLRKPVRVAGYGLLAAASFALAPLLLRAGAGAATPGPGPGFAAVVRPPAVSLTVETGPGVVPPRVEPPVVLPGYLLPDDGVEEPSHAGG
jgi:hypothetical protein